MRIQADLVGQIFNSSEKRLARTLPLMAEFGKPRKPEQYTLKISQETLAEMIGATRSLVSFFMNRFRKLGFIEYNGRIKVHRSLLSVVLLDRLPEPNPRDLPLRPLHNSIGSELIKLKLGVAGTERNRTHARAERAADFSTSGGAWTRKPLRTDSVKRG